MSKRLVQSWSGSYDELELLRSSSQKTGTDHKVREVPYCMSQTQGGIELTRDQITPDQSTSLTNHSDPAKLGTLEASSNDLSRRSSRRFSHDAGNRLG